MAEPTDEELRELMKKLIPKVNLETMKTKQFIALLSKKLGGCDLSSKKKFIKATLTEIINSMDNDDSDEASEEEESEEEEVPKKSKRGGGGLSAVKEISDELAAFLGKGKHMARTAVVKSLWEYIREHDLQNPNDKRQILLDDAMKSVFGVDTFTMFSMNKYVGAHIHPFKPVDLDSASTKKRKAPSKPAKGKVKKPRKQGVQAPYRLSPELASVVGKEILPRPQVTQALWAYIRKHNLQNPEDKREIICDKKLRTVMGGNDRVTMFSMNKHISPHMLEKLDKSQYKHEEQESDEAEEEEVEDKEEEEKESEQEEEESSHDGYES